MLRVVLVFQFVTLALMSWMWFSLISWVRLSRVRWKQD